MIGKGVSSLGSGFATHLYSRTNATKKGICGGVVAAAAAAAAAAVVAVVVVECEVPEPRPDELHYILRGPRAALFC